MPQEGSAFIQDVISNLEASKQRDTEQPILYLRMQLAQYALVQVRVAATAEQSRHGIGGSKCRALEHCTASSSELLKLRLAIACRLLQPLG